MKRWLLSSWLVAAAWICTAADLPPHVFVAYHDSWNEWPASTPQQTSLATLPGYIDIVLLAFAKPDLTYDGDFDIAGSGLEYPMPGRVLRDAIIALKTSHPNTHVLLSVGGAAYNRWRRLALPAIVAFVRDFDLDGVDIDFEPSDPALPDGCGWPHRVRDRCGVGSDRGAGPCGFAPPDVADRLGLERRCVRGGQVSRRAAPFALHRIHAALAAHAPSGRPRSAVDQCL